MEIFNFMKKGSLRFGERPSEAEIEKFLPLLPSELPEEYIDFITTYNGTTGDLPVQPYYFQLWQINQILENNQSYQIPKYLPDYFGIGGSCGGEFFAINLKTGRIFAIPFISMEEKAALLVAKNFEELELLMGLVEDKQT